MSDPVNLAFSTALDLNGSLLPLTTIVYGPQNQHFSGSFHDIFWKITIPPGINMIGARLLANYTTWFPQLHVYLGPAGSPTEIVGDPSTQSPLQIPVSPGNEIFFKSTAAIALLPVDAFTTINIYAAPNKVVPAGSIFINDSSPGYPGVAISSIDGSVLRFFNPWPAGESVKVLETGQVMASDDFAQIRADAGPLIYDVNMETHIAPVMPAAGYTFIGTDQVTGWWVMKRGVGATHCFLVFVDKFGVVSGTVYDMGATSPGTEALSPNEADTKVYFIQKSFSNNEPIQQITIPGGVVSNFIAGSAGLFSPPTLLTLTDDTLLVPYGNATFTVNDVRQYNAAGTLVKTFHIGSGNTIEQLFPAVNDPAEFWVWFQPDNFVNRFQRIRVSDGAILSDISNDKYIQGVSQYNPKTEPPHSLFGTDFSCVPFIPRTLIPVDMPPTITGPTPCCDTTSGPQPTPSTPTSSGGTPVGGSNAGPVPPILTPEWTPACEVGGDVPVAADLVASEIWDY